MNSVRKMPRGNRLGRGACVLLMAGCAAAGAKAQTTQLDVQTSVDGINWSSGNRAVQPGTTVSFRFMVSYVSSGTATPFGFSNLTFQPTISNVTTSDTLRPFAANGNNTNGGSVLDTPNGPFGRISPFASTGPTTSDPYIGHRQTVSGANYLRIARSAITNWVGLGSTTGTAAVNNFNGAGGVVCVQKGASLVSGSDPAFSRQISNLVLLKLAFTLGISTDLRTLTIDAPALGMTRNASTGAREASWFSSSTDNFGGIKTPVQVNSATLTVVPAPASIGVLFIGGAAMVRRRRAAASIQA
ncbi:MAG: PEP-CTERM sorting domain-containing protein [Planctomycetota bacterium]|nr:PEP-CTERM sorting domain-containing protein [Planctomycetota bacterium]